MSDNDDVNSKVVSLKSLAYRDSAEFLRLIKHRLDLIGPERLQSCFLLVNYAADKDVAMDASGNEREVVSTHDFLTLNYTLEMGRLVQLYEQAMAEDHQMGSLIEEFILLSLQRQWGKHI